MARRARDGTLAVVAALAILTVIWPASLDAEDAVEEAGGASIRLSTQARVVQPGDVVLLTVSTTEPLLTVAAGAFTRAFLIWPTDEVNQWQGLVGVPLDTKPGEYEVNVHTRSRAGIDATGRLALTIRPAHFATRAIRVAERFANPPASEANRIVREAKLLADTFGRTRPERLWAGEFVRPVDGAASSSFGRLTMLNGRPGSRHQGADFRAAEGTPVRAPNGGEVVLASDLYFSGNTVILDHGGGLFSLLAHFSRIDAAAGARVARGDILGASGATGRVTGPHLHWAVKLGDVSVSPLSLIEALGGGQRSGPR